MTSRRSKVHTSYAWMYRQYKILKLKEEDIAAKAGVDQATINRWLKKLGLK